MRKTGLYTLCLVYIFLFVMYGVALSAEKTIGVIMTGNISYYKETHKAFTEGFAAVGLGNVEIVLQTPTPEPMSWTNAARKLVSVSADLIVSYGAPATLAAMAETSDSKCRRSFSDNGECRNAQCQQHHLLTSATRVIK